MFLHMPYLFFSLHRITSCCFHFTYTEENQVQVIIPVLKQDNVLID